MSMASMLDFCHTWHELQSDIGQNVATATNRTAIVEHAASAAGKSAKYNPGGGQNFAKPQLALTWGFK